MPSADDPLADAHTAILQAITELKAIGVPVPVALHKAAHALSYALMTQGGAVVIPFKGPEPQR